MPTPPYVLSHAPYRDVMHSSYDLAVLPWGATEAHNYHLPFGTDIIETEFIAVESARIASEKGAKLIVLPVVPYGVNTGQLDIPLTINMNPSTQMAILQDVVSSLEQHGVGKLAIVNGHGGNDFKQMIRELLPRVNLFMCTLNWYTCVDPKLYFEEPGDHAGEMETSIMMHIAPHLVLPLSEAGDGTERRMKIRAFHERWAWTPRRWTKASNDTGVGTPRAASADKGARYIDAITQKIGDFFAELAATDPNKMYE